MAWASIILNRMKEAVDNIPRQEQTGFVRVAHVVSKFKLYAKLKKYRLFWQKVAMSILLINR